MGKQEQYELLALALSYPGEDLTNAVKQGCFDREFGRAAPAGKLEELEVEYCRLFVGPGHVEVPPYESVYRGHEIRMQYGLVLGAAATEVEAEYKQSGLQISSCYTDMPDHISVELWFVAYLEALAGTDTRDEIIKKKQKFVDEHLARWVIPFTSSVIERTKHPWYAYVAQLLANVIMQECRLGIVG